MADISEVETKTLNRTSQPDSSDTNAITKGDSNCPADSTTFINPATATLSSFMIQPDKVVIKPK